MAAPEKTPVPPNNRLDGRAVVPALIWNDEKILARAATALGRDPGIGTTAHAKAIIALFQHHKLDPPTYWAALQWVRRNDIPDRWRSTVVYMLMREGKIVSSQLFRKAPTPPPIDPGENAL